MTSIALSLRRVLDCPVGAVQLHIDKIMSKMMGDKKNIGGKLKCVLLDRIGHCYGAPSMNLN